MIIVVVAFPVRTTSRLIYLLPCRCARYFAGRGFNPPVLFRLLKHATVEEEWGTYILFVRVALTLGALYLKGLEENCTNNSRNPSPRDGDAQFSHGLAGIHLSNGKGETSIKKDGTTRTWYNCCYK